MDYRRMGRIIKKRRKALNITQAQLAEMTGKSTVYISLIESGARHPSIDTLQHIANCLNLTVDSILFEKSNQEGTEAVDEFASLMAGRTESETSFVMDIVREMIRHFKSGDQSPHQRNGRGRTRAQHRGQGSIQAQADPKDWPELQGLLGEPGRPEWQELQQELEPLGWEERQALRAQIGELFQPDNDEWSGDSPGEPEMAADAGAVGDEMDEPGAEGGLDEPQSL